MATTDDDTITTPDTELDAAAGPPVAPSPEPGRPNTVSRSTFLVAVALAGLFGVLAVAMSLVAASVDSERTRAASDREDVARVAGRVVELLVTYDYADPDASREPLAEMAGDLVLEEYESDVLPALRTYMAEIEGRATVTVKDVFVNEIEDNEALAIVVGDVRIASTVAGERSLNNAYFRVSLAEGSRGWEATRVDSVNFRVGSGVLEDPQASTTTSAPPG